MAGIQAMINETTGGYQGNPDYVLYALGSIEYDLGGAVACNSTLGNQAQPELHLLRRCRWRKSGCLLFHRNTRGTEHERKGYPTYKPR